MKEHPILFSAPLVRAILSGTKTQTRRIIKPTSREADGVGVYSGGGALAEVVNTFEGEPFDAPPISCPYGIPGDRLWVREAFRITGWDEDSNAWVQYRADNGTAMRENTEDELEFCDRMSRIWNEAGATERGPDDEDGPEGQLVLPAGVELPWTPSIHMPRWASRITLEITGVRVERLQDISEADAQAEGVEHSDAFMLRTNDQGPPTMREKFAALWQEVYGPESWDANPFCWVISFRRIES